MPRQCSAFGCSNSKFKDRNLSLHKFPLKNKDILQKWLVKVKRQNFTPSESSFLCSEHFTEDDFEYQNFTGRRQIKPGAVPSKFSHLTSASKRKQASYVFRAQTTQQEKVPSRSELHVEIENLKQKLKEKDTELENLRTEKDKEIDTLKCKKDEEMNNLKCQMEILKKHISFINLADEEVKSLTGFSKDRFGCIFKFLALGENLSTYRKNALNPEDVFLLTLIRLRHGVVEEFLATLFRISRGTVNRLFIHCVSVIRNKLLSFNILPRQEPVNAHMLTPLHKSVKRVTGFKIFDSGLSWHLQNIDDILHVCAFLKNFFENPFIMIGAVNEMVVTDSGRKEIKLEEISQT